MSRSGLVDIAAQKIDRPLQEGKIPITTDVFKLSVINKLRDKGFKKQEAIDLLTLFRETLNDCLVKYGFVKMADIGDFYMKWHASRYLPRQDITIPAHYRLRFFTRRKLKDQILRLPYDPNYGKPRYHNSKSAVQKVDIDTPKLPRSRRQVKENPYLNE